MSNMICEKITAIAKDISAIGKNNKNQQQGFYFRGIDDVYNAIQPLLAKHEVFTVPEVMEDRTEERLSKSGGTLIYRVLKMKYTVYASDGSCLSGVVIGEGMDSGDKAANKAMAIAHKYFLLQTFCVPTENGLDPDSESHDVQPITEIPNKGKLARIWLASFEKAKENLGEESYYGVLGVHGYKHHTEIPDDMKEDILEHLRSEYKRGVKDGRGKA